MNIYRNTIYFKVCEAALRPFQEMGGPAATALGIELFENVGEQRLELLDLVAMRA